MANGAILGQTAPTPTAQEVTVQQSTAEQFGLTGDATVDQVLQILKNAAVVNSAGDALETVLGSKLLTIPGVQIATGSYAGTGTYGENNPNSLTFDFAPYFVAVFCKDRAYNYAFFIRNSQRACTDISDYRTGVAVTWDGNTISWYSNSTRYAQLNNNTYDYAYFALA